MFEFDPGFLLRTTLTLGSGFALGLTASGVAETHTLATEIVSFTLPRLGTGLDGFRIAQLSDLHFGPYTGEREIWAAIEATQAAAPDLIVLTGDFVTSTWIFHYGRRSAKQINPCAELLRNLRAPYGVFAILGNHDWGTNANVIAGTLRDAGIQVLRNQAVAMERGGARFWLAGVDCASVRAADLDKTLHGIPGDEPVVLLAHEPDFADEAARHSIDVQLSGHSHGGQVVIPGMPAYLPPLGRKYPRGMYRVGRLALYVNRGLGVTGVPVRFGAVPELTVAELRTA